MRLSWRTGLKRIGWLMRGLMSWSLRRHLMKRSWSWMKQMSRLSLMRWMMMMTMSCRFKTIQLKMILRKIQLKMILRKIQLKMILRLRYCKAFVLGKQL